MNSSVMGWPALSSFQKSLPSGELADAFHTTGCLNMGPGMHLCHYFLQAVSTNSCGLFDSICLSPSLVSTHPVSTTSNMMERRTCETLNLCPSYVVGPQLPSSMAFHHPVALLAESDGSWSHNIWRATHCAYTFEWLENVPTF